MIRRAFLASLAAVLAAPKVLLGRRSYADTEVKIDGVSIEGGPDWRWEHIDEEGNAYVRFRIVNNNVPELVPPKHLVCQGKHLDAARELYS